MHYAIGVALALTYLHASLVLGLNSRNPAYALAFALSTRLLPWPLFPAMGYGWFGTHGATGTRLLLSRLVTHCFCGVGIWLAVSMILTLETTDGSKRNNRHFCNIHPGGGNRNN